MPSFLIVMVSWMSFLIPFELAAPRTTLNITTVLTTTTMWMAIERDLPDASYVKAIDVWKGFCLLSVYTALFEYGVVSFFYRTANDIERTCSRRTKHQRASILVIRDSFNSAMSSIRRRKPNKESGSPLQYQRIRSMMANGHPDAAINLKRKEDAYLCRK